jgi:hypothetical protein
MRLQWPHQGAKNFTNPDLPESMISVSTVIRFMERERRGEKQSKGERVRQRQLEVVGGACVQIKK